MKVFAPKASIMNLNSKPEKLDLKAQRLQLSTETTTNKNSSPILKKGTLKKIISTNIDKIMNMNPANANFSDYERLKYNSIQKVEMWLNSG